MELFDFLRLIHFYDEDEYVKMSDLEAQPDRLFCKIHLVLSAS